MVSCRLRSLPDQASWPVYKLSFGWIATGRQRRSDVSSPAHDCSTAERVLRLLYTRSSRIGEHKNIHENNLVKAGLVKVPEQYPWSNASVEKSLDAARKSAHATP